MSSFWYDVTFEPATITAPAVDNNNRIWDTWKYDRDSNTGSHIIYDRETGRSTTKPWTPPPSKTIKSGADNALDKMVDNISNTAGNSLELINTIVQNLPLIIIVGVGIQVMQIFK